MRFFFSFFPFLPVRVRSRACVKSDKRSHCSQQSTSKISPAQLHHLCQNHRTEFFFFFRHRSKKSSQQLSKKERGGVTKTEEEEEALSETKQSQCSARLVGRRSCPFLSRRTGNNRTARDARALATTQTTPHTLKESFLYKNRCTQRRPAM